MIRLRKRCEEVEDIDELTEDDSPVYYHCTFVIDKEGELVSPITSENPLIEEWEYDGNRFTWTEEWDLPEGSLAVEICITRYGTIYKYCALPEKMTMEQIFAYRKILEEYGIMQQLDIYEYLRIYQKCKNHLHPTFKEPCVQT